ncbi:GGDEF domain-containing protein [Croceicoccus bisphenolivorans]|uniref:GGDEF domain-containing protein n=1 Tax=Croceicoccus bisphenolivorans TaxID=1783232 RepID=UPI001C129FBA|nr:GGDEF domain-containing protein [Croceicoccus bisphenolivorans]
MLLSVLAVNGLIPSIVSSVCLMAAALLIRWNSSQLAGRVVSFVGATLIIFTALLQDAPLLDMTSIGAVLLASAEWMGSLRRSFEAEKSAADYDALTGAASSYAARRILTKELENLRLGGQAIALLFLDLDDFKSINDTQGHAAGDAVLKLLVTKVGEIIGSNNLIARLGGDEFAIVIRDVKDRQELSSIGRQITHAVGTVRPNLTASIGAILLESPSHNLLDDILSEADQIMYRVKRNGKASFRMAEAPKQDLVLAA